MDHSCFQKPDWYQAVFLSERIASLKSIQNERLADIDRDLAQRRLDRWKTQSPFDKESYFAQRLATEEIGEAEFFQILGEPTEAVRDRAASPQGNRHSFPPDWLTDFAQAFAQSTAAEPMTFPEALQEIQTLGFLEIIEPLIRQGRDRLHQGIQTLIQNTADLPFDPDTIATLLWLNLPTQLLMIANRTLVLELNVARLQGLLQGETPEERFQSFIQRLRQRDVALSILQEYPVLARQLTICIQHWVTVSLEFLQHLCGDWALIRSQFAPEPGLLTEVSGGAGDSHRDGRSVMIAKFSSGFQIVYKPRSLSLDIHFQTLLNWINERGNHPPFRVLNLCDRGTYGWVEFVTAQPCTTEAEVQRFYERQGGYLAILYVLEAADFHHENLIAAGEYPILLDLEALFHPRVGGADLKQADQLANSTLGYSVYGIGLLPHRIWSNHQSEGIDISGLGAAAGQLTPHEVMSWDGVGTDEMKLTRKRVELPGEQNRPTLNGEPVNVLDYAEAITTGFTQVYDLLRQHRDHLLVEEGPLADFAHDTIRVIARATQTYAMLLMESFHPDVLRNALDRDRLLDRLWLAVEYAPHLGQLVSAERKDLLKGDIPMFTTRPDSRDLWTSSGQRIPDFLDQPSLAAVQHRLRQLDESDLARQLWIIRASLTSLHLSTEEQKSRSIAPLISLETVADRDRLLAAACAVGDRLESLALQGEQDASWIGLTLLNERHWSVSPLGLDLYDGLPGVILFLAYLGNLTGEARYTALARAALTTVQRQIEQSRSNPIQMGIGGFSGWGGVIYAFTHLGKLWQQPELIAEAEGIVELLPVLIQQDETLDIIGGAAGCIGSLLTLYHCAPTDQTLDAALQCGDRLVSLAQPQPRGVGWSAKGITNPKPLAGFSHGAAGIAWVLLELSALSGEKRFRTTALEAIAYERSLFSPEAMNWPDLREFETSVQTGREDRVSFMTAWCHGAPGIGLGRLQCLPYLKDSQIHAEIDAAIETTLAQGFGGNHSLCHGSLGNLDLLLQAAESLEDNRWQPQIDRLAALMLESIQQQGWQCGIPLGVESPGLMTGLAGIGYELLRLAEPTQVPSVLVLAPPKSSSVNHALSQPIALQGSR